MVSSDQPGALASAWRSWPGDADPPKSADAVVVGGGTVGAWCAYFLRQAGLARVVLVEQDTLGQGASSRAAGVVRTQGGTPWAVLLGEWSRQFYLSQREELGIDSGFIPHGYVLPCFSEPEVAAARERMAMQNSLGLDVRWLSPDEVDALNPTFAPGKTLGATYCPQDGYLHPPRNVIAYCVALATSGVRVFERTRFTGLATVGDAVTGVLTSVGPVSTPLVVLTGGPELAAVGGLAGLRIPAGGVRHQVVVTQPHPDLAPSRLPMVFDLPAGLYWRPEEGGMLFGMSNPDEPPGEAGSIDMEYLDRMRKRLAERRITLQLTPAAMELIANEGYDPTYGARPLKRVIQRRIQDPMAMAVLDGKFREGDTVLVDAEKGQLVLRKAGAKEPAGVAAS